MRARGDEIIRQLGRGRFSRTELVRSFMRKPDDGVLPTVAETGLSTEWAAARTGFAAEAGEAFRLAPR